MLNESRREEEAREDVARRQAVRRDQLATLKGLFFTLAVVIAPFLALIFGLTEALFVLAVGLGFTFWLTWSGAKQVGPVQASRLRTAAYLNLVLVVVTLVIVVIRITS
jgi:Flp pilus assembly protein TadB